MRSDELAAKIIGDAQTRAEALRAETSRELSSLERETDTLVRERKKRLYDEAHAHEEVQRRREDARRRRDADAARLATKHELLDAVFEEAATRLAKLSGKARAAVLERLWARTRGVKIVTGIAAKSDVSFLKKRVRDVRTAPGNGGFVVATKDGRVTFDLRFETVLAQVRERKMDEVAEVLFR